MPRLDFLAHLPDLSAIMSVFVPACDKDAGLLDATRLSVWYIFAQGEWKAVIASGTE